MNEEIRDDEHKIESNDIDIDENNDYLLDTNAFDSIMSDLNILATKHKDVNTTEVFLKQIDDKFDNICKNLASSMDTTISFVEGNFNNADVTETEDNAKEGQNFLEKDKNKKEKKATAKDKGKIDKKKEALAKKQIAEIAKIKEKENRLKALSPFEREYEILIEKLGQMIGKVQAVEELNKGFDQKSLENIFTIDKYGNFYLKRIKQLGSLMNKKYKAIDLNWDTENSNKITISDDSITINSTGCYNWFRTDVWFTKEDESFIVEFTFETSNTTNAGFYIGVQNESINYPSECMCCNISNCIYLKRNGDVIENKQRKPVLELAYTTLLAATLSVIFVPKDKNVFFRVNDSKGYGPYKFLNGEKFKIISGCCGVLNDSKLTLNKASYV